MMNNDTPADAIKPCRYCGGQKRFQIVSPVSDHAWADCFCVKDRTTSLAAQDFQQRVEPWFRECFPPAVCDDRLERGDRLLEEVLELLQSGDYPPERVAALVDYTWGRPKGEPVQEVGGVMVTLAAYCIAHNLDMGEAGEIELARINRPEIVQKIRAKQAAKPTGSALPVAPSLAAQDGTVEALRRILRLRPAGDVATATGTRALVQQMETIARAALASIEVKSS